MALIHHNDGDTRTRALEPFDHPFFNWPGPGLGGLRRFFDLEEDVIKVEEFMDGNELVVRAELPGVDPDRDVEISMVDGALCIRAERRKEEKTEGRHMRRSELHYGSFSRTIALPPGAKESDIKAIYKDGLLEVRCPIEERAGTSSKIPIARQ